MRKAVNLSLDEELVKEARRLGINLSRQVESSLQEAVRAAREQAWLAENAQAIEEHNARVAERGCFGDRNKLW